MDARTAVAVSCAIWHPGEASLVATTQNTVSTPVMQDVMMLFSDRAPMKSLIFGGGAENEGFCLSSLSFERQYRWSVFSFDDESCVKSARPVWPVAPKMA